MLALAHAHLQARVDPERPSLICGHWLLVLWYKTGLLFLEQSDPRELRTTILSLLCNIQSLWELKVSTLGHDF